MVARIPWRRHVLNSSSSKTGKEIARLLALSPRMVDTYRDGLMDKLQVHTVADVVRYAVRAAAVN